MLQAADYALPDADTGAPVYASSLTTAYESGGAGHYGEPLTTPTDSDYGVPLTTPTHSDYGTPLTTAGARKGGRVRGGASADAHC